MGRLAAGPTRSYAGSKRALNSMLYPDLDGPARPGGRDPARLGANGGLRGGRGRFRGEARTRVQGRLKSAGGGEPGRARDMMPPALPARRSRTPQPHRPARPRGGAGSPSRGRAGRDGRRVHARVGRLAQRGRHRHALQDRAVRGDPDLPARGGHADLVAGQVPRAPGRPRAGPDPRQHAPRARLDGRRGPDPGGAGGSSPSSTSATSRTRPRPGPTAWRAGVQVASIDQPAATPQRRPQHRDRGERPAVPVALRLSRARRSSTTTAWWCPPNTTVVLKITSSDVIHSWWIPKLGGKADAVPGHTNETWFKISKEGIYKGQCAELCGSNHADMRGRGAGRAARALHGLPAPPAAPASVPRSRASPSSAAGREEQMTATWPAPRS